MDEADQNKNNVLSVSDALGRYNLRSKEKHEDRAKASPSHQRKKLAIAPPVHLCGAEFTWI